MREGLLAGKTAIVTGGANGVGSSIVRRFLGEGARVLILDVEEPSTEVHSDDLRFVRGSVTSEEDVRAAVHEATSWSGSLDVMVNNAGVQIETSLAETSLTEFNRVLDVNVLGVFLGTREAAKWMSAGGSIINIGSALGSTGDPLLAAYCASKGAVVNFTRAAAADLGRRSIRVNCLSPGAVATPLMTRMWDMAPDPEAARRAMESAYPLGRIVEPDEVGRAAVFLASDMSSAVHGAVLAVDCGLTAANPEFPSVVALGSSY